MSYITDRSYLAWEYDYTVFGVPQNPNAGPFTPICIQWITNSLTPLDFIGFLSYYARRRTEMGMHPKMSQMLGQIVENPDDYQKLEKWKRTESFPDYALSNFGRLKRADGTGDILYAHATMKVSDLDDHIVLRFMINDGKERSNPTLDGLYDEVWGE